MKTIEQLQDENRRLKEFARYVLETCAWGTPAKDYISYFIADVGQYGGDFEEFAEKLGLINLQKVTLQMKNEFPESDIGIGEECYRYSKILEEE